MLSERDNFLIASFPKTDYGQAFMSWLEEEIDTLEYQEEFSAKICDDPLIEDFRVKMGIKIGLKRVLRKPQECLENINKNGDLK